MKRTKALSIPADNDNGSFGVAAGSLSGRVTAVEKAMIQRMLEALGRPALKVVLWNGEEFDGSASAPVARLQIHDRRALYKLISNPELQFGELYSTGRVEVDGNLVSFLETVYASGSSITWISPWNEHLGRWLRRSRTNTLAGSRNNIHHHYDISNEFYTLWLDHEMQYTCAYFPDPQMTLEAAQTAKLDHVCRKLQLKPGDRVVEAGCGWGGLARHMARHYGAQVTAYNISHEQIAYARERAKHEGLADQVQYIEDDYRTISGEYDAFVSVGMLEHVGRENYGELGGVMDRSLTRYGRALIHSIGRNRPGRLNPWIEKRIFPGGYPPSLREMLEVFEPYNFSVLDVENLRLHYAKTLEHWLERYEQHFEQVCNMFDSNFARAWRLYLAGSIAAFTMSTLQLFQVTAARARDNSIPWNREHLYVDAH